MKERKEIRVLTMIRNIFNRFKISISKIGKSIKNELEGKYVIIRSYDSGVHAGVFIKDKHTLSGRMVTLKDSRRIWYWDGAATLSELSVNGTAKPEKCKFPCEVSLIEVDRVCEVIPCTVMAEKSIKSVPVWSHKNG